MSRYLRAIALGLTLVLLPGCGGCGPSGEKGANREKDMPRSGIDVELGPEPIEVKDGKEKPKPKVKDEKADKDSPEPAKK